MTLDDLFKHGQEAAEYLFKIQGEIQPMWICETESGQMFPIAVEMPDRDKRDITIRALKDTFKRNNVVRYVSLLEAWSVAVPSYADFHKGYSGSLADHEDRREVILIQAEDKKGEVRYGLFYILRPENAKPKLSPFKTTDSTDKNEGRFTHLLKPEE